ncbi:hypothetical protein K1719_026105 [Acacia pycnantha]|nr:hypothetical protein K1719_026105 [Acacia pycnantha]
MQIRNEARHQAQKFKLLCQSHQEETEANRSHESRRSARRLCKPRALFLVEGRIVSEIGPGLLVLVGLHDSDSDADADYICRKVLNMRLFPNESTGKGWDQSVMQRNYQVLLVSQFTLYGFLKGNKLDFHVAMPPQKAKPFYASLVDRFRNAYNNDAIKDGVLER